MKLSDFKNRIDKFTEEWVSVQSDGSIKMSSHNADATIRFLS